MRAQGLLLLAGCAALSLQAGPCSPGPGVWNEGDLGQTDAGKSLAGANNTTGAGSLTTICGNLNNDAGGADLFEIFITGNVFAAITSPRNGSTLDPALYLFDVNGNGVYANNDLSNANPQALLPGVAVTPGLYFLAVVPDNQEPENHANNLIFGDITGTRNLRLPKTNNITLDGWTNTGDSSGQYIVSLDGAAFANAPEPAALALVGGGLLFLAVLRKRLS